MVSVIKILVLCQLIYKLNFIPKGFLKELSKWWFQMGWSSSCQTHIGSKRKRKDVEQKGIPQSDALYSHSGTPAAKI